MNHLTLELERVDNLKAIDIKKETAVLNAPRVISSVTVSDIKLSDLLNYVNKLMPDTLSESVLRQFNRTERPISSKEDPANYALYSDRDSEGNTLTKAQMEYFKDSMEYSFTWIESLSKNKPSTDFSAEGFVYITYRVISE